MSTASDKIRPRSGQDGIPTGTLGTSDAPPPVPVAARRRQSDEVACPKVLDRMTWESSIDTGFSQD